MRAPQQRRPPRLRRRRWHGDIASVEDSQAFLDFVHGKEAARALVEAGRGALKRAVTARVVAGTIARLRGFVDSAMALESPAGLPEGTALRGFVPALGELSRMVDATRAVVSVVRGLDAALRKYEDVDRVPFADLVDPRLELAAMVVLAGRAQKVVVAPSDLAAVAFIVDSSERAGTHITRANTWKKRLRRAGPIIGWFQLENAAGASGQLDLGKFSSPRVGPKNRP